MDFGTNSMNQRHRDEKQAAEAPAFLRRDSDRPGGVRYTDGPTPEVEKVQQIPYYRAISDLVYELDTQSAALHSLLDRLAGVLEPPAPSDAAGNADPCPYSSSPLVQGLACQVQRMRYHNATLVDIVQRLAI